MFPALYPLSALDIYLCPGSNLDQDVSLGLADRHATHYAVTGPSTVFSKEL